MLHTHRLCVCMVAQLHAHEKAFAQLKLVLEHAFLRRFRDPIRVPRIENRVPRIREIGSLQVHTGYLTCSLKKNPWGNTVCVCDVDTGMLNVEELTT